MAEDRPNRRESIFEVLDELIFHLNTTRGLFTFLIVSAFILGPLSLIVAAIFAVHPRLLVFLLERSPEAGGIVILFLSLTVFMAITWLFIGIRERAFFSQWNTRFSSFMSLRARIDRELGDDPKANSADGKEEPEGK
ncbi:MAG: hypothetical protein ABI361_03875 [Nitrososphaera sp.]|jgi:hypothetical protein